MVISMVVVSMSDIQSVLPINPDSVHEELESIEKIIRKWKDLIDKGIPGVDIPCQDAEAKVDLFLRQFTSELLFVGGKCSNLAILLSER